MRTVKFNNKKYYFIYLEEDSRVFDASKNQLSAKDITSLGFVSVAQFANFLKKLEESTSQNQKNYHDDQSFLEVVSENLLIEATKQISLALGRKFLEGINYSIVKKHDISSTLELLNTICTKHSLTYKKIFIDYPNNLKVKALRTRKYLVSPYGELTKKGLYILPLTTQLILKELNSL